MSSTSVLSSKKELDLSQLRRRYPLTVSNFGSLSERESWLYRICTAEDHWQKVIEKQSLKPAEEVILKGSLPTNLSIEENFDLIYAGSHIGLLHAAIMASRYGNRVMIFDEELNRGVHYSWNISADDLKEFNKTGLLTEEELKEIILNRNDATFVKFHDAGSCVKAPPLWMDGVLDATLDGDRLLALVAKKFKSHVSNGSLLLDAHRFIRSYIQPDRVVVELESISNGARRLFAARLFIDATNSYSPIAKQLNEDHSITHVCPTVGTIARGFIKGEDTDQVNFKVGEILVSKEDARDHRQLMWDGFASRAGADEFTTHLFFYDAVDSPADKSLLSLFERYFESLPSYKRQGGQWRVIQPVFGYIPSSNNQRWANSRTTATDRIMLIGEAIGNSSPITIGGIGQHLRSLHRSTHLTSLALDADLLDKQALSEVSFLEPKVAPMTNFAEFIRPTAKGEPTAVNETLNAIMAALHNLDVRVRQDLFQDRLSLGSLKNLLTQTAKLYPRIFKRVREHMGARGTFWCLANIAEAILRERRSSETKMLGNDKQNREAIKEFTRYINLYKREQR
jgi:lycopene cyclase CruA